MTQYSVQQMFHLNQQEKEAIIHSALHLTAVQTSIKKLIEFFRSP